jgi:hypothetical protein
MILNDVEEFEIWACPSCRGIIAVDNVDEEPKKYVTKSSLQKQVNQAKKESSQEGNSYFLAGMYIFLCFFGLCIYYFSFLFSHSNPLLIIHYTDQGSFYLTSTINEQHSKQFLLLHKSIEDGKERKIKPLTVMSVFSGIGSELVTLKRLRIAIKTVVSIDHDRIATHVAKWNHDCRYNKNLVDDGICYVWLDDEFENLNIDKILQDVGPIDIILGGPPCSDHSQINATRKGIDGKSGNYMIQFGNLIETIQKHPMQLQRHLYFLSENVICDKDDEEIVDSVYGVPALRLDAQDFSPCKRNRNYWTNIPFSSYNRSENDESIDRCSFPSDLEHGFQHPVKIIDPDILFVKANTFLASKGKLDDSRMMTVKKIENGCTKYQVGTYSILDREKMMGYPSGYIWNAVIFLWNALANDASGDNWKDKLDVKLHHFYECEFTFKNNVLQISTELEHRQERICLTCNEYAKRLVGNAWSIPVVEALLSPLQLVCESKDYEGFNHKFYWRVLE